MNAGQYLWGKYEQAVCILAIEEIEINEVEFAECQQEVQGEIVVASIVMAGTMTVLSWPTILVDQYVAC